MFANFAISFVGFLGLLLTLGACSDNTLPKWISGEPTPAEINAYSGPIAMPPEPAADAEYPNLADVPPRPQPMLTPAERQDEAESLQRENEEGQKALRNYNRASR